jgi:hypothetical protein
VFGVQALESYGALAKLINFCNDNPVIITLEKSRELNDHAWDSMEHIEGFTLLNEDKILKENLIRGKLAFTSSFTNLFFSPGNKKNWRRSFHCFLY